MVLPERFELSTSPLPRECSTPELRQRLGGFEGARRPAGFGESGGFRRVLLSRPTMPPGMRALLPQQPRGRKLCFRFFWWTLVEFLKKLQACLRRLDPDLKSGWKTGP